MQLTHWVPSDREALLGGCAFCTILLEWEQATAKLGMRPMSPWLRNLPASRRVL